ncbi:MAG: replicative DNA helicase [Oscillospiraceae bacterium]|jgi:replicative DNA helicase|nr:replicative DNA helicase [Oscillospiraceae bacterium]
MDELRQLPHSAEAEQAVIGSILLHGESISQALDILRTDDFYTEACRDMFSVMLSMFNAGSPIDPVTLLDELGKAGLAKTNSREFLSRLLTNTPTWKNIVQYANIVRDKAKLRGIAEAAADIAAAIAEGTATADEALDFAERRIYSLRTGRGSGGLTPVADIISDFYETLRDLAANGGAVSGLPTGLAMLDNTIMGLNKSDLILLASRPGVGKTSLALNMALAVAKKDPTKVIAYFTLEMSKEQIVARMLSGEAFIDSKKMRTGQLNPDDWRKLAQAVATISHTGIRVDDNSMLTVSEMNAQCRRIDNLGLIVIDYLQLMNSPNAENRLQAVSEMSRMMKIMARELAVPVLCLCQLSRASATRENKRPVLSDLRESGSLEQDADIVLGIYREDYYKSDTEDPNAAELIVLKNRHGETANIKLRWVPEFTTYTEQDDRYE